MAGQKTSLFGKWQDGGMFGVIDQHVTTGDIWFVGSTVSGATDGAGYGQSPISPCATIDYAIGLATASQGDIIYVMPGHAETIAAAGIDVDKAGLSIIGLGVGNNRPTITLNATTSDVDIDAAGVLIRGLRFVSSVNNLAWFIDVNTAYFTMEDCEFVTASATEAYNFINIATTVDNFIFRRCRFLQPTDPNGTDGGANTGCFYIDDSENILIEDCEFLGEFETSIIHNDTTACKNLWVRRCFGEQALAGADVITLEAGATGGMDHCSWNVPDAADATTWGSFATVAADTPFGFHNTTFMNDNNAGEQLALPIAVATA